MVSKTDQSPVTRRSLYINSDAESWNSETFPISLRQSISKFHMTLPGYQVTRLVSLNSIAKDLGVKELYVKDETIRCNLPAFKILGASWAAFKAIAEYFSLPHDVDVDVLSTAAQRNKLTLLAAMEGNHGRAIAKIAMILGLPARIFVPKHMDSSVIEIIQGEGAEVIVTSGSYDHALLVAKDAACEHSQILVQDTTIPGYSEIPQVYRHLSRIAFDTNVSIGLLMATIP
jgi:diaminopropionate ammonia-lyase family